MIFISGFFPFSNAVQIICMGMYLYIYTWVWMNINSRPKRKFMCALNLMAEMLFGREKNTHEDSIKPNPKLYIIWHNEHYWNAQCATMQTFFVFVPWVWLWIVYIYCCTRTVMFIDFKLHWKTDVTASSSKTWNVMTRNHFEMIELEIIDFCTRDMCDQCNYITMVSTY